MPHRIFFTLVATLFLLPLFISSIPVYGQITMSLDVSSASIGTKVTVTGTTLPFSRVNIYFESMLVASTMSNASGGYEASFFVPMVNSGDYNVYVENVDTYEKAGQPFKVTYGIDSLKNDLESVKSDTSSIQSGIDYISNRLQLLDSINSGVSNALNMLDKIDNNIENLDNYVRQSFNTLIDGISNVEYTVNNLTQDLLQISSKIDNILQSLDGFDDSLSKVSSDVNNLASKINSISQSLNDINNLVDTLSQDIQSGFDKVSSDVKALEDKIPGPDMITPILSGLGLVFTLAVLALLFKEFYLK